MKKAIIRDWRGNTNSIFKNLGASNHTSNQRQTHDYYATDPKAIDILLEVEKFSNNVWECACGEGHLSEALKKHGYNVRSTDLVYRGYGEQKDFLFFNDEIFDGDIITNPPYLKAEEFIIKALSIIPEGRKVAMFLRLLFLEGKKRKKLFELYPPKHIYVSSSRIACAMNGDFGKYQRGKAVAYAWFVWQKGYNGQTILKWIN